MKMGAYLLRLLFPSDERQRMELRMRMATSAAHTEDMCRTVRIDGEAIRAALSRLRSSNDPQNIVQFDTLAPICEDRGRTENWVQLCAHPQAAEGQQCEQHACPVIVGQTKRLKAREVA